jgi:hypothetical protein
MENGSQIIARSGMLVLIFKIENSSGGISRRWGAYHVVKALIRSLYSGA